MSAVEQTTAAVLCRAWCHKHQWAWSLFQKTGVDKPTAAAVAAYHTCAAAVGAGAAAADAVFSAVVAVAVTLAVCHCVEVLANV